MLRRTFLHIPGIGELTERRIWSRGLRTWDDFLAAHTRGSLAGHRLEQAEADVRESAGRFDRGDWNWFDRRLPSPYKWRAFGDLGERALYVDIETTGIGAEDPITVIGTFDGRRARAFVAGENLDAARELLEQHPLLVTFNGTLFDLPLIRARFGHNLFNHIHVDLRFVLRRLGLQGGLKRIEQAVGLARSGRTRGLDGWDAVRLWRAYEDGSREALDLLLEYNREDVVNLQPLMRLAWEQLTRPAGEAGSG